MSALKPPDADKTYRRHVYSDLQPYVCIIEHCKTPNRLFNHRREWEDHILQESGTLSGRDMCPLCHVILPSAKKWRNHVGREMQQLALFAIPKEMYDGGDGNAVESDSVVESEGRASPESERLSGSDDDPSFDVPNQTYQPFKSSKRGFVPEILLPTYGLLQTLHKALTELQRSEGLYSDEELTPYVSKVNEHRALNISQSF
jgi:hypothetical protein